MKKILLLLLAFFIILFFSCQNEPVDLIKLDTLEGKKTDFSQKDYVIYGDCRTNHYAHIDVVNLIQKHEPKMIFNTGDLVENGTEDEWEIFNDIIEPLLATAKYYPALGNHDTRKIENYFNNFILPNNERWYIIKTNKINFIILNSNESLDIDSEQYIWLESTLQNIDTLTKFTAIVFHHPPYNVGEHTPSSNLKNSIIPLFENYNVDIVFNGHDHNYQRFYVNGIYYIVTGGGGGPLHNKTRDDPYCQKFVKVYHYCTLSVENNELQIEVIDVFSTIIDKFKVIKQ